MTEKQLAEFFVEQRVLQPSQADDVLSEVELNGKTVAQAMIDGGFIDEPSFYKTFASGPGTKFILGKPGCGGGWSIRSKCRSLRTSVSRSAKTLTSSCRRLSKSKG